MSNLKDKKLNLIASLGSCRENIDGEIRYRELLKKRMQLKDQELDIWKFYNALGNKIRLNILRILKEGEYCVCEFEVILNKSQPTISHHLRILENANLIRAWKKGKFAFYVFRKDQFEKELNALKELFLDD